MKAFILYSTYTTQENRTTIQLFGKLENGQSFCTLNKFKPCFYIRKADKKKIPKKLKTTKTNLKNFANEPVLKVEFDTFPEQQLNYKNLKKEIEIYEADRKPPIQFLTEKNCLAKIEIKGDHEPSERIDRIYNEPEIKSAENFEPELKIVSLDTESDGENLYCIGLTHKNYRKNFMITDQKLENTISCKNEEKCLEKFKQEIIKLDPDILTGWNVIDFDFAFLKNLFKKHKMRFDIGRTGEEPRLRIQANFFRNSTIDIPGRQVLDGLALIRDPFIRDSPFIRNAKFKSLSLEDVSQEILGKGKLIKGKDRHIEIKRLYKSNKKQDLQKLVNYNLMDAELVEKILEKTKVINLSAERSQLVGLPIDRIGGSIAAFDSLYIRKAHEKNLASPTHHYTQKQERIKGGYVESFKPGIYHGVLVLDFKSLYPSIIQTFNISPETFLGGKPQKDSIETPNKMHFKKQRGIQPEILAELHKAREKAKKENRVLSSHAIKITMNSFFGVLASPNSRYFSLDLANSITHFGQFLIKLTAKEIEKKFKVKVIYSDTDSVFVVSNLEKTKADKLGEEIQDYINKFYKKYVKENYGQESFLELEFEKQYLSMMIPKIRGTEKAAKKRYAGLRIKNGKEELEITGLEAIRGDWTQAAQEFQIQLLDKLFHKQPIEKFVREYVKKIQAGKLDDKLVYRKSIRKELEEYTKTTPPHVKAARKLPKLDSNIIEYYVTTAGPEPIQAHKHKIDYDHYIEKQIKPIANQILTVFDKDFQDVSEKSKQTKLF